MDKRIWNKKLYQASHLIILICHTVFAMFLTGDAFLMHWELWPMVLVGVGVVTCWLVHIRRQFDDVTRLWYYWIVIMLTYFYYGIHPACLFNLAPIMIVLCIVATMTGIRGFIYACHFTFIGTMMYCLFEYFSDGGEITTHFIIRLSLHVVLVLVTGFFNGIVISRWSLMIEETQEELDSMKQSAERLDDFLANASHEIRTPINAVMGLTGVCLERHKGDEDERELMGVMQAGQRMSDQVSDILDYSEIDSGKVILAEEDYMISSLLSDVVTSLKPYMRNDVELVLDIDPSIPSIMKGDIYKLKRIMWHLITNSLKYTKDGGVYVHMTTMEMEYGANLCLDVYDTGIGMKQEEITRMFDRFYQADSGRSRTDAGLGLGLPVVQGFVRLMGGFITVESELNIGTKVHVCIPQSVVDGNSCMTVKDREHVTLAAYFSFNKYPIPDVRQYYNSMITNIVKGMGVGLHGVDNMENLKKVMESFRISHVFIGMKEYETDIAYIEKLAKQVPVYLTADPDYELPENSNVRFFEKPLYCFPIIRALNEDSVNRGEDKPGKMRCKGVRVLVVDDEPMNLKVADRILSGYGMVVDTADSGIEGVMMCRENTYDVVFMDHMTPGMDGVEAAKRIRAEAQNRKSMSIVAFTANLVSTAREMFVREGFDGFVGKPIDLTELERTLRKVLPTSYISYSDAPLKPVARTFIRPKTSDRSEKNDVPTIKENIATVESSDTDTAAATVERQSGTDTAMDSRSDHQTTAASIEDRSEQMDVDTQDLSENSLYPVLRSHGIDTKTGLDYCQDDDDLYMAILSDFAGKEPGNIAYMDECLREGRTTDYEIRVHAIKGTSRLLGAKDLADRLQSLEDLASAGRASELRDAHDAVMHVYSDLAHLISDSI